MMKIGKEDLFAIIECVLFLIGAIFLAVVFIDSSNPVWALWVGLVFAGIGVILWLRPLFGKLIPKKAAVPTEITETTAADETYELHRPIPQTTDQDTHPKHGKKRPQSGDVDF